jgi:hypothetical protein
MFLQLSEIRHLYPEVSKGKVTGSYSGRLDETFM